MGTAASHAVWPAMLPEPAHGNDSAALEYLYALRRQDEALARAVASSIGARTERNLLYGVVLSTDESLFPCAAIVAPVEAFAYATLGQIVRDVGENLSHRWRKVIPYAVVSAIERQLEMELEAHRSAALVAQRIAALEAHQGAARSPAPAETR